jgi:hypothetical protein
MISRRKGGFNYFLGFLRHGRRSDLEEMPFRACVRQDQDAASAPPG